MLVDNTLKEYSKLVLTLGVNLQKGQGLEISCPVEKSQVAKALTQEAYNMGAKIVRVRWQNQEIDRLNYLYADKNALTSIPKFYVDSKMDLVKNNFCYVAIDADNPNAFLDVPSDRLMGVSKARSIALKRFSEAVMSNGIRWCVVSVPSKEWAKLVFPNTNNPEELLSIAIEKTMRLDLDNPLLAWQNHIKKLEERALFLNNQNFEYLHYESKNGTNINVGLAKDHVWLSAKERAMDGISFIANMPTEEVFTAPHNKKVNGIVKSSIPLCFNGQIIDGITLKFKNGKIVEYSAEKGYDILKELIETDKGTYRLGEVALIGKNSPIRQCNILFYNTLFDENASCHLAIGKAYPTTVKNGENLSKEELKKLGVNDSVEHVDFMVGADDINIYGIKYDGTKIQLFNDGEWII